MFGRYFGNRGSKNPHSDNQGETKLMEPKDVIEDFITKSQKLKIQNRRKHREYRKMKKKEKRKFEESFSAAENDCKEAEDMMQEMGKNTKFTSNINYYNLLLDKRLNLDDKYKADLRETFNYTLSEKLEGPKPDEYDPLDILRKLLDTKKKKFETNQELKDILRDSYTSLGHILRIIELKLGGGYEEPNRMVEIDKIVDKIIVIEILEDIIMEGLGKNIAMVTDKIDDKTEIAKDHRYKEAGDMVLREISSEEYFNKLKARLFSPVIPFAPVSTAAIFITMKDKAKIWREQERVKKIMLDKGEDTELPEGLVMAELIPEGLVMAEPIPAGLVLNTYREIYETLERWEKEWTDKNKTLFGRMMIRLGDWGSQFGGKYKKTKRKKSKKTKRKKSKKTKRRKSKRRKFTKKR